MPCSNSHGGVRGLASLASSGSSDQNGLGGVLRRAANSARSALCARCSPLRLESTSVDRDLVDSARPGLDVFVVDHHHGKGVAARCERKIWRRLAGEIITPNETSSIA